MLREFKFSNFKAFSEPEAISIKPITLIYGPNSAGKSSIIQSLMLLKQTLEDSQSSETVLLPKGKLVDTGSFSKFIHCREIDNRFSVRFKLDANTHKLRISDSTSLSNSSDARKYLEGEILNHPQLEMEIGFRHDQKQAVAIVSDVTAWVGENSVPLITLTGRGEGSGLFVEEIPSSHEFWTVWWNELKLTLSSKFFNQTNKILEDYEIGKFSKREKRDIDIESELRGKKDDVASELIALKDRLKIKQGKLDETVFSLEKLDISLEVLSSEQLNSQGYKQCEDDIEELEKECKKAELFIDFEQPDRLSKAKISEMATGKAICELVFISEDIPQNLFDEVQISALEKLQSSLRKKYEFDIKHSEERQKYEEPKSALQQLENQLHNEIVGIQTSLGSLKEGLQCLEWLHVISQRIKKYESSDEIDKDAINDYLSTLRDLRVLTENFLPTNWYEVSDDSQEMTQDKFKKNLFAEIFDGYIAIELVLNIVFFAGDIVREFFQNSIYIGPVRERPERFYTLSGSTVSAVEKTGRGTAAMLFQNPDFVDEVNQALKVFELGYEIKVIKFKDEETNHFSDMYAIRLIDEKFKVGVSPLDVGYGISQVLPVIVQCLSAREQTIVIEQPEVHIHPRLQTELASLLTNSVNLYENSFIVESHSEHLMLRLQKLIRQKKISPDKISVLYVDRNSVGSVILQLRLDEEGDFIDAWPDGFFDEGFNEII